MTITVHLSGHAMNGRYRPDGIEYAIAAAELVDEGADVVLSFPLDPHEVIDFHRARSAPGLERRVEELEHAIGEHQAATQAELADTDLPRSANGMLWAHVLKNPNNVAAREVGVPDFDRRLTADEARELAAVLVHYATELERR